MSPPFLLVVLEGAAQADPPPKLRALPHAASALDASGPAVGLREGAPGGAESGWSTLGAGRAVPPRAALADREAASGKLALRERLRTLFRAVHFLSGPAPSDPFGLGPSPFEEDRRSALHVFFLLSDDPSRPSRATRRALIDAAADDGLVLRAHAILDHGISLSRAARLLEELAMELERKGTLATVSGRRFGFDAHGDFGKALRLFEAVVRASGDVPKAGDWIDVLGEAAALGVRPEDLQPTRLGGFTGMRGSFFADFSAGTGTWAWNAEDAALLVGSRPTDFGTFARLLLRVEVPDDVSGGALSERGKAVRALSPATLAPLFPIDLAAALEPVLSPPAGEASLLADLARAGRALAVVPASRRHALAYLGAGAVPGGVDVRALETDRDEPELSVRALLAPVRAALEAESHDVIVVSLPELDRAAHAAEPLATVAAWRAIDRGLAPLVERVLAAGGRACVVSPYAAGAEGAAAEHRGHTCERAPLWLFGPGAALEPQGALADVAPTLAAWLGLPPVAGATGRSLLRG